MHGIESAVFDLDADRHARTQGGMLDIHGETGQAALRAAGLDLDLSIRATVPGPRTPQGEAVEVPA